MRILLSFALLAGAALAQGPPAGAPPLDSIKTYLSLSDTQVSSLQAILQQERQAMQSVQQEMRTKQKALHDALAAGSTDAAALGKMLLDLQSTRKSVETSRTTYAEQAKNVLTAAQKTKLQALEQAQLLFDEVRGAVGLHLIAPAQGEGFGPGMFMGPGPGGPGGRGGPGPAGGPRRFRP